MNGFGENHIFMNDKKQLLALLDQSAEDSRFPFWELGEQNNLVLKMRLSGWYSSEGIGLLFEVFGYSAKETLIQTLAVFLPTFKSDEWIKTTNIFLDRIFFTENNQRLDGQVKIKGQMLYFTSESISGYNIQDDFKVPLSILLSMKSVFSDEIIFNSISNLKKIFKMPDDSKCLFQTQNWNHPSFEDYWEKGILPSRNKSFIAMAQALSLGEAKFKTITSSNTSWDAQSKKITN